MDLSSNISWDISWDLQLRWPWVVVGGVVLVVALLLWWTRAPRPAGGDRLLVAHVERLRALPRYAALVRRQQLVTAYLSVAALVVVAGALLVAARPQVTEVTQDDDTSRDIVLCLDASGSMQPYNVDVVRQVRGIVRELAGERIGLSVFSGATVTIVPLTDDYAFVLDQLDRAEAAFRAGEYDFVAGVQLGDDRASQLGDGIASCTRGFDRPDEDRGRAIIVASDNDPQGPPVYTVQQGARYAARRDIVVHGIASPDTPTQAARSEFRRAVTSTGGTFSVLGEDGSAEQVLERINGLEAKRIEKPPRVVERDRPDAGIVVIGAGLALLLLGWLVEALLVASGRRPRRTSGGAT